MRAKSLKSSQIFKSPHVLFSQAQSHMSRYYCEYYMGTHLLVGLSYIVGLGQFENTAS